MSKEISFVDLKEGEKGIIMQIKAGWQAAKRLSDLGLVPGTKIKILKKTLLFGPLEIEVRGSRLVLGRGMASKILVERYG